MEQPAIVKSYSATSKAWYPAPSGELTGTLTSTGKMINGTGTLFSSEIDEGDYLLNAATDDVQKVARIESNTILYLEAAMATDLAGVKCRRIKNKSVRGMQVVFATANGTIRGASQATGSDAAWPTSAVWRQKNELGMDPQLITPSSGLASVTLKY